jgi:hypothetical protein
MLNNNRDFLKSQGTKRPAGQQGLSVTCPQCGAGIAYDQGRTVCICPFCDSAIAVQLQQPVTRWLIRPVLSRSDCFRLLSAWLWENYHGAASCPEIVAQEWVAWTYTMDEDHNNQPQRARLADPGNYPELHDINLPVGEHLPFSDEAAQGFILPASPVQPASPAQPATSREQQNVAARTIYMPAYIASFKLGQQRVRAVIEAATGKVRGHIQTRQAARLRRWIAFGIAALVLAIEAFAIPNIVARLIVLGITYAGLEVALGLVWEGLLWRK